MKLLKTFCVVFVFGSLLQSCTVSGGHQKCAAYSQSIMDQSPDSEELSLDIEEKKEV